MRSLLLVTLILPTVACAQAGQRGRYSGAGQGPFAATAPAIPAQIIAPGVPVLDGLPHAIKIGYTVYIAGMVPLDSAGTLASTDFTAQARQVVSNIAAVMRAANGVPGDVVRVTAYIRDLAPERVAAVRSAILDGLDRAQPPALTVVGVATLAEPGFELTVEATGQLRSEFPDRSRLGP